MSLEAGREAFRRGALEEARAHFEKCAAEGESPEALEELGLVAWWRDDAATTFDARERAYRLYRDRDDVRGAARVALWLVWDSLAFRGDTAVASGWMERARRLLEGHEDSAEFGWLLAREGEVTLFRAHDPRAACTIAVRAAEIGRRLADRALEFTGLALEGLALVSAGDVAPGLRRLDEATAAATAGEVKELHAVGVVCCWQIFACERVRDFERAAQWCARAEEFTRRWHLRPLSAVCRAQYAGVQIWRGHWAEAEAELLAAVQDLESARPAMAVQAIARLGELRLRQGRFADASRLFEQAASQPVARVGRAALLLEQGEADESAAELERFLAYVGDKEPTIRAGALELSVRSHAARGDRAAATKALEELDDIARSIPTTPMMAAAVIAEGALLRAFGAPSDAARCFQRAVDLFQESGAPFEVAQARLALAHVLAENGSRGAATREAGLARDAFHSLGAHAYEARAAAWLAGVSIGTSTQRGRQALPLTTRQIEILRLLAKGLSNPQIAVRLRLSEHTVKRHVANLFTKLRLSSRAAAAAYAAQHDLL
ncbi:MAG TPA: LuxR C-terminal-related transcriptional regulator [Gemmatimonadaceae bacterium]|nr:LuxR C-terminal-related transcriptional regulator [Gemmatimonadaceae bacterium]